MFTPQTDLVLCHVPLSTDQKHQLDFASSAAQHAYFYGKKLFTLTDLEYQVKDGQVSVELAIDTLWSVNYCYYRNAALPDKWFYAFVTKMQYINEEVTRLSLETDVFQTWLFDFALQACFVEREHEDETT